ncbi:nucleic acid/nucleotide deaminase of polymorphic system toxin [Halopolyspora algeriensis]|uniref:Nucleic acid/nucleotide deaminase of polymorphic system toxin n=1 Tax=Halopolyspora algeriensis TaxID=1500506 RepID=A0A368VG48_9ACTN|nr:DddA-like double-stranded DNA deaminase toxin [Halopolyspora algeriensis]RCW39185.1 nucleic acid/nucleotide deaminase of polymorphic system toxin [Halopolyspora algeriensis]TQM47447.1 nucleic acid/nucleotide deaminase of polymorphic system toxin [Halopolyspora algeriensis]
MAESALERLAARLRGVLVSVEIARAAVHSAAESAGESRDGLVAATYGTEDAELVEGIGGAAQVVLDLEYEIDRADAARSLIERYLASLGVDGSSPGVEDGTGDGSVPAAGRPEFGSPEWVAEVGRRIAPEEGTHVTTGIGFDDHGTEVGRIRSTEDHLAEQTYTFLADSVQFPKPLGWRVGDKLATVAHTETKFAMWMRQHGIRNLTVVINHRKVCGRPHGCQVAVRTILPRGSTMTVISSMSGIRWELKGVATP